MKMWFDSLLSDARASFLIIFSISIHISYLCRLISDQPLGQTTAAGKEGDVYYAPFVVMTILAVMFMIALLFFLILVIRRRGQTEVKNITFRNMKKRTSIQTAQGKRRASLISCCRQNNSFSYFQRKNASILVGTM